MKTVDYITERGSRGSRDDFERVLRTIGESPAPPLDADRLPEGYPLNLP
ncbi:MAG: hypothetical protein IPK16_26605 [Anaerolineales bacterium]|nr:hypothetical protein [Anaerolineales bacterium]